MSELGIVNHRIHAKINVSGKEMLNVWAYQKLHSWFGLEELGHSLLIYSNTFRERLSIVDGCKMEGVPIAILVEVSDQGIEVGCYIFCMLPAILQCCLFLHLLSTLRVRVQVVVDVPSHLSLYCLLLALPKLSYTRGAVSPLVQLRGIERAI